MAPNPKPARKPVDILPAHRMVVQDPRDTTDENAHVPLGPKHFGAEAGPAFSSNFPRTTRGRKRKSF